MLSLRKSYQIFWAYLVFATVAFFGGIVCLSYIATVAIADGGDLSHTTGVVKTSILSVVGVVIGVLPLIAGLTGERWSQLKQIPYNLSHQSKSMN